MLRSLVGSEMCIRDRAPRVGGDGNRGEHVSARTIGSKDPQFGAAVLDVLSLIHI